MWKVVEAKNYQSEEAPTAANNYANTNTTQQIPKITHKLINATNTPQLTTSHNTENQFTTLFSLLQTNATNTQLSPPQPHIPHLNTPNPNLPHPHTTQLTSLTLNHFLRLFFPHLIRRSRGNVGKNPGGLKLDVGLVVPGEHLHNLGHNAGAVRQKKGKGLREGKVKWKGEQQTMKRSSMLWWFMDVEL